MTRWADPSSLGRPSSKMCDQPVYQYVFGTIGCCWLFHIYFYLPE
jgi:hypothetical protein